MLSVIIPAFNEEKMISRTAETLLEILQKENIPCELLFVDDGSTDATWAEIRQAANKSAAVRGIHFSRNFVPYSHLSYFSLGYRITPRAICSVFSH